MKQFNSFIGAWFTFILIVGISFNLSAQTAHVDTIWRMAGVDSIYFKINGVQYAILDSAGGAAWKLTGNSGTSPSTNFIGTTDNSLVIKSGNLEAVKLYPYASGFSPDTGLVTVRDLLGVTDFYGLGQMIFPYDVSKGLFMLPYFGSYCLGEISTSGWTNGLSLNPFSTTYSLGENLPNFNKGVLANTSTGIYVLGEFNDSANKGLTIEDNQCILGAANTLGTHFTVDYGSDKFIFNNGNVGIGTFSPSQKLHVTHRDTTNVSAGMILENLCSTNKNSEIKFLQNGTPLWAIGNDVTHNNRQNFFIYDNAANGGSGATRFYIDSMGRVGIGVIPPTSWSTSVHYKLYVDSGIATRDVRVTAGSYPDYVFHKGYKPMTLKALEKYIVSNKHLPDVPSEAEVKKNDGFELGDMQQKLLKKLEEMTLYIIEQQKQIDALRVEVKQIKK